MPLVECCTSTIIIDSSMTGRNNYPTNIKSAHVAGGQISNTICTGFFLVGVLGPSARSNYATQMHPHPSPSKIRRTLNLHGQ
jgi:hypothetical protein